MTTGIDPPSRQVSEYGRNNLDKYQQWKESYEGKSCYGKRCPHLGTTMLDLGTHYECPLHKLKGNKKTNKIEEIQMEKVLVYDNENYELSGLFSSGTDDCSKDKKTGFLLAYYGSIIFLSDPKDMLKDKNKICLQKHDSNLKITVPKNQVFKMKIISSNEPKNEVLSATEKGGGKEKKQPIKKRKRLFG